MSLKKASTEEAIANHNPATGVTEIDADTHKVFKYLAENVPESSVIHCPGIDIRDVDDEPGEDSMWVRELYPQVSDTIFRLRL